MSEKTEKATPKQIRDAREKGQVGQSQDLGKLLVLMVVSEITLGLADDSVDRLQALLALSFKGIDRSFAASVELIASEGLSVLLSFTLCSVGMAMLMRLVSSWMQIGFLFAPKALKLDINKINPFSHAKQMFSGQNILNLLLSILKAVAIGATLYMQVKPALGALILLANSDLTTYWHALVELFRHILRVILGLLLVVAMVDFAMQKYFHAKKLRMSHEDIKKNTNSPKAILMSKAIVDNCPMKSSTRSPAPPPIRWRKQTCCWSTRRTTRWRCITGQARRLCR